jgi:tetratricopeptide (TPR) repeat protein
MMPTYKITDPNSGKTFRITGDSPPSEEELNNIFQSQGQQLGSSNVIPRNVPTDWGRRVAGAISPYARPVLEMGGMMGGGALASPVAPPFGTVAGAGLGYAAGKQLADVMDIYAGKMKQPSLQQGLIGAAKDVPAGMAMEVGGRALSWPLEKGLQAVTKAAPKIYESVAKIPPRSVPVATREKAVQTALEYKIPPTKRGIEKLQSMIESTNDKISQIIDEAQEWSKRGIELNKKVGRMEYEEGQIFVPAVLRKLNDVKQWARKSFADPKPVLDEINATKREIASSRGKWITPAEAQELKKGIYRRLGDPAYKFGVDPKLVVPKKIDKSFAKGLKEQLVRQFPELQKLNATDSSLINLEKVLEGSVNRIRNWDIAGLSEYAGAIGGAELAGAGGAGIGLIMSKLLRSPAVMSRLSFALNKASRLIPAAKGAAKIGAYETIKKSTENKNSNNSLGEPSNPLNSTKNNLENRLGNLISQFSTPAYAEDTSLKSSMKSPLQSMESKKNFIPQPTIIPTEGRAKDLYQTGLQSYLTGDYDQALNNFRIAIRLDPIHSQMYKTAINQILQEKKGMKKIKKGIYVSRENEEEPS